MELFHTSPTEITEINAAGRFGEFLCFADEPYKMSASDVFTYRIEVSDDEVISARSLFWHEDAEKLAPFVEQVMQMAECDEDMAEALIAQRADVHELDHIDPENMADMSWDIQKVTAKAAKALGFRGVAMNDEQGVCYMIDMLGRENELDRAS